MRRSTRRVIDTLALSIALSLLWSTAALATPLAPPNVDLQGQGLSIAEGGVGLESLGSGTENLSITIGGPVQQAFLYWGGRQLSDCPEGACFKSPNVEPFRDQKLIFGGTNITGSIVGTEDELQGNIGYMADVTSIVQPAGAGTHNFSIADGDLASNLDRLTGAGLIVIYTDPSDSTIYRIMIADGLDFAFGLGRTPLPFADNYITSPVTFSYASAATSRTAELTLFVGDAEAGRPDRVDISDNPSITDSLDGSDGGSWDTDTHPVTIPASVAGTTVQLISAPPGTPAPDSLLWMVAALRVPIPAESQGCTPGYWKNHHAAWAGSSLSPNQTVSSVFTVPAALSSLGASTLDQALAFGGGGGTVGGAKILLRAATAAMLNAGHSSVNYPMTPSQVRDAVNAALASNNRNTMLSLASQLDADNNRGCPLN